LNLVLWAGAGLLLLAGGAVVAWRILAVERAAAITGAEASLLSLVEGRSETIRHSIAERASATALQALSSPIAHPLTALARGDQPAAHRDQLQRELDRLLLECTDCTSVTVNDPEGRTLAASPVVRSESVVPSAALAPSRPAAPSPPGPAPTVTDRDHPAPPAPGLRFDPATGQARLVLVGAIRDDDDGGERTFGYLVIEVDPTVGLFAHLKSWPTGARTGELLLVERHGEEVLVLNELRLRGPDLGLLHLPISGSTPAARASRGATGVVSGRDYRGAEVVAAARPVAGTGWTLLAKEDVDEVLGPFRERVRLYLVALLGVALAIAGLLAMFYQQLRVRALRAEERALAAELEERRLRGVELARSELRFRSLAVATSQIVWNTNAAGEVVDDLPTWQAYTGLASQEVRGFGWLSSIHPDDAGLAEQAWRQAVAARSQYAVTYRLRRADGRFGSFEVQGVPVRDPSGSVIEWIGTCTDISPRLQAEEALRASEEYLRRLIESLGVGVVVHGADTAIVTSNREATRVLGLTGDELRGKTATDPAWRFLSPDGSALPIELLPVNQVVTTGLPFSGQVFGVDRADGTPPRWVLVNAYPTTDGQGALQHVVVSFSDVTDQRRAETEAARLAEHLRVSQKIEAIGRLAGGVAHDFNNILSVILGHTAFALEAMEPGDPLRDDLLEVEKAGRRAAALTSQLLAFGGRQVLQPRPVALNQVVVELEKMLRRVIGEDIQLGLSLAGGLWPILADPGQLEQVIMNLVINARDAMPEGGQLTLRTGNLRLGAASGSALAPGSYVELSVTDTGIGIDAATRARIFEPFFTTKPVGKGTGLGLSTVYGIVSQSGGEVQVESRPGHGATFRVLFPRALPVEAAPASAGHGEATSRVTRGSETILVVEDEAAVRDVTRRILAAAGYRVLTADCGAEALRLCREHPGEIGLLLSDVVMPRMGGRECANQALRLRPGLRVLFMSGYAEEAIAQQGVLQPGTRLLGKPFSAAELTRQVREVLHGPLPPVPPVPPEVPAPAPPPEAGP
jgi:PAS domain S-box-containing protein